LVQFSKIRLSGFKSFVDATELLIEPGLTGVVGPNGCGKSNLVEALRWVMGENSARRMRGGEMDDVIFGGTSDRPSRNIAEVAVTLDNSLRSAPAAFNDSDELVVTRKIERGCGSAYKVNGKDVRARDVTLLFADAATGAQSTGLVSQGQIGALINARPAERRHLLEEAAGIAGLHSRRNEAEQKLKAASTNLERLDDVLVTLNKQLENLRKQAKSAIRYRRLSEQIRHNDAKLLHLRWSAAKQEREHAQRQFAEAEAIVAELTTHVARATTNQTNSALVLPELRNKEAAAAAELQRLLVAREQIDQEESRLGQERQEVERHLEQSRQDMERERSLAEDAAAARTRLEEERAELLQDSEGEEAACEAAAACVDAAKDKVEIDEAAQASLTEAIAEAEARQRELDRSVEELQRRRQRLQDRMSDLRAQREELASQAEALEAAEAAEEAVAMAEEQLEDARLQAEDAELQRTHYQETHQRYNEALQKERAAYDRLAAEASALEDLLASEKEESTAPILDSLTVEAGYEAALGAAFGDDLAAPEGKDHPEASSRWATLPAYDPVPDLPVGMASLQEKVKAPQALARRLSQIGLVGALEEALAQQAALKPGQALVTRAGDLVRWDGYQSSASAPTGAAVRLKQRNRLVELQDMLVEAEIRVETALDHLEDAREAMQQAEIVEKTAREAVRDHFAAVNKARQELSQLAEQAGQLRSKITGVEDSLQRFQDEIAETEIEAEEVLQKRESLPDLAAQRAQLGALRETVGASRAALIEAKASFDRIAREGEERRRRLGAIAEEGANWDKRVAAAAGHLASLETRHADFQDRLESLAQRPLEIEERRTKLVDLIAISEDKKRLAGDALAQAETEANESQKDLKEKEAHLAKARETAVRAEGAVAQTRQNEQAVEERIAERLRCAPEKALEAAGLGEIIVDDDPDALESRLRRLNSERETMGAVNLRAEIEVQEMETQIEGMENERADLETAIGKLRQGIATLNKEARERLMQAFYQVNESFEKLFARLFNGGKAYLQLTDPDDPLHTGLEIMASPPGKRLQILSLLSGGEQALTALALLFAVFLSNPAPICVLDEVDAPLDDANVDRMCQLVQEISRTTGTRFLLITHHRMTMAQVDRLFGVTMAERGVSQLVSVDLRTAEALRESA